jgi:hypothetical protein
MTPSHLRRAKTVTCHDFSERWSHATVGEDTFPVTSPGRVDGQPSRSITTGQHDHRGGRGLPRPQHGGATRRPYAQRMNRLSATHVISRCLLSTAQSWMPSTRARGGAPAMWNRHVATLRSFGAFARRRGWVVEDPAVVLERRKEPAGRTKAITASSLAELFHHEDVAIRADSASARLRPVRNSGLSPPGCTWSGVTNGIEIGGRPRVPASSARRLFVLMLRG